MSVCGTTAVNYVLDKLVYGTADEEDEEEEQQPGNGGAVDAKRRADVAAEILEGRHALVAFEVSHPSSSLPPRPQLTHNQPYQRRSLSYLACHFC